MKIVSITPLPENRSEVGLVIDSLAALRFFHENALSRFTLFDLRHIWPDGSELEVQRHLWPRGPESLASAEAVVFFFTESPPDLDSPRLLSVLRGPAGLSEQAIEGMLGGLFTPAPDRPRFWYAVAHPPGSVEKYEAVVFGAAKPYPLP